MPLAAFSFAAALGQLHTQRVEIRLEKKVSVGLASQPVEVNGSRLAILGVGDATFRLEPQRLSIIHPPVEASDVPPGLYGYQWNNFPKPEKTGSDLKVEVSEGPFLTASVKLSVLQYNKMTYRVSCAVFAKDGTLLGAAAHDERVDYIRLGVIPTLLHEVTFDFGASRDFSRAAYALFAISNPKVPPLPGQ